MNFDFSDDEKMVADQVARFLADKCGPAVVRDILETDKPFSEDVWRGLTEMGLAGAAIGEEHGGVDAGYLTLCLVAEQLGASLAPVPFSSSVYLAVEALKQFGSNTQKEQWLPKLASGESIGTFAAIETTEEPRVDNISSTFSDGVLNGCKLIVPDGSSADMAIVLAKSNDGPGLYLADLSTGAERISVETVDPSKDSSTLTFTNCPAQLLGVGGSGFEQMDSVYDSAAVLIAFEQIGGARRALDMAVNYASERFAFGRPIGSFQALKHMMADMYVALRLAECNCHYAAWALSTGSEELPLAAATARVSATQAYQLCSRDNIQIHGGMGFTWEFDCHLYYRRSNYLTLLLGGLSTWEDRLVSQLPNAA